MLFWCSESVSVGVSPSVFVNNQAKHPRCCCFSSALPSYICCMFEFCDSTIAHYQAQQMHLSSSAFLGLGYSQFNLETQIYQLCELVSLLSYSWLALLTALLVWYFRHTLLLDTWSSWCGWGRHGQMWKRDLGMTFLVLHTQSTTTLCWDSVSDSLILASLVQDFNKLHIVPELSDFHCWFPPKALYLNTCFPT